MDALQMWQQGFPETVACQGTALTLLHMQQLKNATQSVFLMFDGDNAGRSANLKLIEDAIQLSDVEFKVASLADGEDPDTFSKQHGQEGIETLLGESTDLISYCVGVRLKASHSMAIPEMISKDFVPWLSKISDPIKRDYLISQLAQKTGVAAASIKLSINSLEKANRRKDQPVSTYKQKVPDSQEPPLPEYDQNSMPETDDIQQNYAQLTPIGKELLGHLYYSHPEDVQTEELTLFIKNELGESALWEAFATEMLTALKNNNSPYKQDVGLWELTHEPQVTRFLDWIQNNEEAFSCSNRSAKITKLKLIHKQNSLKKRVSYLKQKLTIESNQLDSTQDWQEIIQIVSQLNGELKNIQTQLTHSNE
jgi:DNA primase